MVPPSFKAALVGESYLKAPINYCDSQLPKRVAPRASFLFAPLENNITTSKVDNRLGQGGAGISPYVIWKEIGCFQYNRAGVANKASLRQLTPFQSSESVTGDLRQNHVNISEHEVHKNCNEYMNKPLPEIISLLLGLWVLLCVLSLPFGYALSLALCLPVAGMMGIVIGPIIVWNDSDLTLIFRILYSLALFASLIAVIWGTYKRECFWGKVSCVSGVVCAVLVGIFGWGIAV